MMEHNWHLAGEDFLINSQSAEQYSASRVVRGSSNAAKGSSTTGLVSIATALWEITAQWQADHGTQPSAVSDSDLLIPRVGGEHIKRWQTQVSPRMRLLANPGLSCTRSMMHVPTHAYLTRRR